MIFIESLGRDAELERLQVRAQGLLGDEPGHALVEQFAVPRVDVRGLKGHRAVEEDGKRPDFFRAKHPREQAGDELRTVREQHRINPFLRRGRRTIQGIGFLAALEQAAIHEHIRLLGLNVISRTGDFTACGADNFDFHGQ